MRKNMENERKDIRTLAEKYDKLQTLMCYVNKETSNKTMANREYARKPSRCNRKIK